jgi:hypothetical protein
VPVGRSTLNSQATFAMAGRHYPIVFRLPSLTLQSGATSFRPPTCATTNRSVERPSMLGAAKAGSCACLTR